MQVHVMIATVQGSFGSRVCQARMLWHGTLTLHGFQLQRINSDRCSTQKSLRPSRSKGTARANQNC